MSDDLIYTVADNIGHIILNRPQRRNALTFDMYKRIGEICATVGTEKDSDRVKVLILSGSGDAAFAAGTDISQFHDFKGAADGLKYEKNMEAVLDQIETCNVPTIAALNGFVTGGGAGIAASCSIRIGSEDLKVGVPIARTLGNCLAIGTLRRFVPLVGFARTRYILLTAQLIDGREASTAGFISELLADKTAVTERAFEIAAAMTNFAPLTLKASMTSLNRMQAATTMPNDDDIIEMCYGSDDFKEGMSAFFEKRKPNWQGK
jgi:enoyl-CoA hydratase